MIGKFMLGAAVSAAMVLAQAPVEKRIERDVVVIASPGGPGEHGAGMRAAGGMITGMDMSAEGGQGFAWVGSEMGFELANVKGAPFQADFVTETTQTLADGNRIKNSNKSSFARDGDGRTRRESTLSMVGPWADGTSHTTIFIHDPVAKVHYVLDPQAKTARKISMPDMAYAATSDEADKTTEFKSADGKTMVFERKIGGPVPRGVRVERMQKEGGELHGAVAGAATGMQVKQMHVIKVAGGENVASESLGKRVIEGVEAEGTRTRLTIAAGQIGNEKPIEVVSDKWYSNELKTVVLSSRKDPRAGETVYRATGLRRGEPARQLFEVPSEYKVFEEKSDGPIKIMKIEKK